MQSTPTIQLTVDKVTVRYPNGNEALKAAEFHLHGGTINVASEVDAGTTFIVTMPIDPFEDSADGKDTGC